MKVRKWVAVDAEIEVDLSCEGINGCAQWLKAIPDGMIREMSIAQRQIIANFYREQANRFLPDSTDECAKQ